MLHDLDCVTHTSGQLPKARHCDHFGEAVLADGPHDTKSIDRFVVGNDTSGPVNFDAYAELLLALYNRWIGRVTLQAVTFGGNTDVTELISVRFKPMTFRVGAAAKVCQDDSQ